MRKKVLITGAGGYIGSELISQLSNSVSWDVVAMTSNPDALKHKFRDADNLKVIPNDALANGNLPWDKISHVIHLAFARRFRPNQEIAESMVFSKEIFSQANRANVEGFVNLSSQSVYGNAECLRDEATPISPEMIYSMAKYASEIILESIFEKNSLSKTTNIRMDPVAGNQNLLPSLVKQAYTQGAIKLTGGGQIFSLLDISDAAAALICLINTPTRKWKKAYNVGWNNTIYTLLELAEMVAKEVEKESSMPVKITIEEANIRTYAGLNSTIFMEDTSWKPQKNMNKIIENIIREYRDKACNV